MKLSPTFCMLFIGLISLLLSCQTPKYYNPVKSVTIGAYALIDEKQMLESMQDRLKYGDLASIDKLLQSSRVEDDYLGILTDHAGLIISAFNRSFIGKNIRQIYVSPSWDRRLTERMMDGEIPVNFVDGHYLFHLRLRYFENEKMYLLLFSPIGPEMYRYFYPIFW